LFAIILHGWRGANELWIEKLIGKLLEFRGGCVIFFNYSTYSQNEDYIAVLSHWEMLSALLTRKLQQMEEIGIEGSNIFLYGHSLGARIVIDAAVNFGKQKIGLIDLCDMAGPGFNFMQRHDPKDAAQNVQCIHTTNSLGTFVYNCHQDWLMGW